MIAYKLFRKLKDGKIAPLFINKRKRVPFDIWLDAEEHPTKGFAVRKGWHCTLQPIAPHLSTRNRVWVEVEISDFEYYNRPESQGGTWVLAQRMKALRELVKDKLFTVEDVVLAFRTGIEHGINPKKINTTEYIKSILPKTEWEVEFDEQGKLKMI